MRPLALIACLFAAAQPIEVPSAEPRAEIVSYDLHLDVHPESRELIGRADVELTASDGTLESVRFSLNAGFTIDEVRDGKRETKPKRGDRIAEGRAWTVGLSPPLKPGKRRTVHFEYHGQGADPGPEDSDWMGVVLVREDEVRMSHQSQWYPIVPLDDRARAKLAAPTTLELVLPRGMQSLGPGELKKVEKMKAVEVHQWHSAGPVRPSILAGEFEEQLVKAGKQRVRVLSFEEHRKGAKRWAQEAGRAIEVLARRYGDLGRRTYGLGEMHVLNRERSYNYEADGFSVYDSVLFDGRAPDPGKIAHEVAHLYFGAAVDPVGPGERFLVESMAEAAAFVYLEESEGEEAATRAAARRAQRYFEDPGEELAVAATDFDSPRYYPVVYAKGTLALRTLRDWGGADEFDRALRNWIEACTEGESEPTLESLLKELRAALAIDVDAWAADWLRRPGAPAYELEFETAPGGKSRTKVTGQLVQKGELYRNPVELGLVSKGGKRSLIRVIPREGRSLFEAVVPHDVERVELDPRHLLLLERD